MTLFHEMSDATTDRHPDRAALRHQGLSCSYEELAERSRRAAAGLRGLGVGRGDRVAVYLKNRPEAVEVALACSRIGAIFVPINPMLKSRQLGFILRDSGARMVVLTAQSLSAVAQDVAASPGIASLVTCDGMAEPKDSLPANIEYERLIDERADADSAPGCIDKDPAMMMYTSSSTGPPKGVVLSHHNVVEGARCVAQYLGNRADDRLLAALPLSFDYGFSQVSTAISVGACAVLAHYSLATTLLQVIEAEAVSGLAGVPTMWGQLAGAEWPARIRETLRYITSSGGTIAPTTLTALQARLPRTRIYCMYGLTEAFRSTYLDPAELARRPHSIGKAAPNQEVLVLRPDGTVCDDDEDGELVHRGSFVTLGYWNNPALTAERFRPLPAGESGLIDEIAVWSGDVVRRDAEGYLYFRGRRDHQIKTSGYRVSPTEIEEVVMEVPGVLEAVVVGLPDDRLGQTIVLSIVGDAAAGQSLLDDVRRHCRYHLPAFMVPGHIFRLSAIPRNPNGKHDRAAVRQELEALTAGAGACPTP